MDFDFIKCRQHYTILKSSVIDVEIIRCINTWCKIINRMLDGKDTTRTINPIMRQAQQKYSVRLKKKKTNIC